MKAIFLLLLEFYKDSFSEPGCVLVIMCHGMGRIPFRRIVVSITGAMSSIYTEWWIEIPSQYRCAERYQR